MARARYEIRVSGRLSERARSAFAALEVRPLPPQTIMFGELTEGSGLRELLALCSAMGLEVVSLQRLPAEGDRRDGGHPSGMMRRPPPAVTLAPGASPDTTSGGAPGREGEDET